MSVKISIKTRNLGLIMEGRIRCASCVVRPASPEGYAVIKECVEDLKIMAGDNAEVKECVEDLKIMAGMYLRGEVEVGMLFVMLTLLQMRVRHAVSGCEDYQTWERVARVLRAEEVGVKTEK